jgi:hypothetical protein
MPNLAYPWGTLYVKGLHLYMPNLFVCLSVRDTICEGLHLYIPNLVCLSLRNTI